MMGYCHVLPELPLAHSSNRQATMFTTMFQWRVAQCCKCCFRSIVIRKHFKMHCVCLLCRSGISLISSCSVYSNVKPDNSMSYALTNLKLNWIELSAALLVSIYRWDAIFFLICIFKVITWSIKNRCFNCFDLMFILYYAAHTRE